jgi:ZIP family zinc transporter
MTLALVGLATVAATLLGGAFALYLRDRLHLILGFSAGAIIAVAFFNLLPEGLELASKSYDATTVLTVTVLGFAAYLVFDRLVLLHAHADEDHSGHAHGHEHGHEAEPRRANGGRGTAGAASLSVHSFLDGLGIGLAFQVSTSVGAVVTAAVLAHDFSDGINTVNMVLRHDGNRVRALRWLVADALAPVLGIAASALFRVPETELGLALALFAGFFLYIGASDLIPESYHAHPVRWTTISTVAGMAVLFVIIRLAGI